MQKIPNLQTKPSFGFQVAGTSSMFHSFSIQSNLLGGYKRALSRIVDFLYSAGDEASKFAIRDCAGRSVQVVIGNRSFIVLMSLTTLTERSNWSNISPMF